MRRFVCLLLALATLVTALPAFAAEDQGLIEGMTRIDATKNRKIKLKKVEDNLPEEGVSPTTGLTLADLAVPEGFAGLAVTGRYQPMLVQIDNDGGGIKDPKGVNVSPWGASYADIVYEMPLYADGRTRLSFLFSDLLPDSVGPVRSARMAHAWLREEWGAGFVYYGQQEYGKVNVRKELTKYGAELGTLLFMGTASTSKPWKKFYTKRTGSLSPHHINANVAAISELVPADHTPTNHAFKFTDEFPTQGDNAETITVRWIYEKIGKVNEPRYCSTLEYDWDNNVYYRYMHYEKDNYLPWEDRDSKEQIAFSNVIVQFTEVEYAGSIAAPVAFTVGDYYYTGKGDKSAEGNADFFMGGKHIEGYWKRKNMESRTVFYGPDGKEIELQRGKTLIIVCPTYSWIDYQ